MLAEMSGFLHKKNGFSLAVFLLSLPQLFLTFLKSDLDWFLSKAEGVDGSHGHLDHLHLHLLDSPGHQGLNTHQDGVQWITNNSFRKESRVLMATIN